MSFAGAHGLRVEEPVQRHLRAPYTHGFLGELAGRARAAAGHVRRHGVGLAAAPPGVGAIGRELVVYWREAAVGHDALAYYRGSNDARGRG